MKKNIQMVPEQAWLTCRKGRIRLCDFDKSLPKKGTFVRQCEGGEGLTKRGEGWQGNIGAWYHQSDHQAACILTVVVAFMWYCYLAAFRYACKDKCLSDVGLWFCVNIFATFIQTIAAFLSRFLCKCQNFCFASNRVQIIFFIFLCCNNGINKCKEGFIHWHIYSGKICEKLLKRLNLHSKETALRIMWGNSLQIGGDAPRCGKRGN